VVAVVELFVLLLVDQLFKCFVNLEIIEKYYNTTTVYILFHHLLLHRGTSIGWAGIHKT